MERIKKLSLKKAFFAISLLFLMVGILLGVASFMMCTRLLSNLGTNDQFIINYDNGIPNVTMVPRDKKIDWLVNFLSIGQFVLPTFFALTALFMATIVFYRLKLKKPLAQLQTGTERIMQEDLDFSIQNTSHDELGELCIAFEAMRVELLKNKQELWRQMEERKRLNAAFSHDLRNPITVLKGAAKILQKNIDQGDLSVNNARDTVSLITGYVGRIEDYVEAMSSVQKLEDLTCTRQVSNWQTFTNELETSLTILSSDTGKEVQLSYPKCDRQIWIDKSMVQNIAENLISNALRYSTCTVSVTLGLDRDHLTLCVTDDGLGFSPTILNKGAEPFLRDYSSPENQHFGMGLYVCRLLCEKHGGWLTLQNTSFGAMVTATFCMKP